jgi:hypothetical protein
MYLQICRNHKKLGSANRKSAKCHICGRFANLTKLFKSTNFIDFIDFFYGYFSIHCLQNRACFTSYRANTPLTESSGLCWDTKYYTVWQRSVLLTEFPTNIEASGVLCLMPVFFFSSKTNNQTSALRRLLKSL